MQPMAKPWLKSSWFLIFMVWSPLLVVKFLWSDADTLGMENTEPTIQQLVEMLAAMGERQKTLTAKELAELRQAAAWLFPLPKVQGIRVDLPNARGQYPRR